jgi:hypothetical protein
VKEGVPFDVAFSLDEEERAAFVIIFGQLRGHEFDWHARGWKPRKR